MNGIVEELRENNIEYIHSSDVHGQNDPVSVEELRNANMDKEVGAVIIGTDYTFNYRKLVYGSLYI